MLNMAALGQTGRDPRGASRTFKFPAAVGGLNRRDGKADMPPEDANLLDNFIPRPNYVELRRGYESYATGMPSAVETLMEYSGVTGNQFFACSGGGIYDISSPGAVGSPDVSGLTNNRWQWLNFATAGGNFLIAVNGADAPRNYNGTTWATTPAITGVTAADLIHVWQWKNRLWFVEKDSLSAWYLPVSSIGGAAVELPLGGQFYRGGHLVAGGSFSYDAGAGPDDYLAFISSQGEVVIYQGTDPSSATTFSLVGRFVVGPPIGRRCLLQVAGDLALLTIDGVVSLIEAMKLDRSATARSAITNKIQDLFNEYARDYKSNFGWQGQIYPRGSLVLYNVPLSSSQAVQLVMNTETGSWCRFTNMNGSCWALYSDDVYFGGDGVVYKADSSRQDNGGVISFDYQSAWSNYGTNGQQKLFQEIRSLIVSNSQPSFQQSLNVDFADVPPTGSVSSSVPSNSLWAAALWGTGQWGGDTSYFQWASVGAIGEWGAIRIRGSLSGVSLQLNAFTISAEPGGLH